MKHFQNKVVVITGAGSGIGLACAQEYAKAGARVHLVDIEATRVQTATKKLRDSGVSAFAHVTDCASVPEVQSLADSIYKQEGQVDILQNGVGILMAMSFAEMSAEQWQRIFQVNYFSAVNCLQTFLPRMLAKNTPAHIVNISSVGGFFSIPYLSGYCSTKFALNGLTESLSYELSHSKIIFSLVCPGAVRTGLMRDGVMSLPGNSAARFTKIVDQTALSPELVAKRILIGVRRQKRMIIPDRRVSFLWWTCRMFPSFVSSLAQWVTKQILRHYKVYYAIGRPRRQSKID